MTLENRKPVHYNSPQQAEAAFYRAFEQADIEHMLGVWDEGNDVECVHPIGPRLRGRAVLDSWREMFRAAQPLAFHLSDHRAITGPDLAVHTLIENILFRDGSAKPLRILATHVFRRTRSGWRLILRHASPAPFKPQPSAATSVH